VRAALLIACALALAGCKTSSANDVDEIPQYDDQLKVDDLKVGDGPEAVEGRVLKVRYTGWLTNGTRFDSNADGDPLEFKLGARQVIRGWDRGLVGMKVGGKRRLTIPPELAYGSRGSPPAIGPDQTLLFEVELLDVTLK
jgi:FKBP-type peptidyl-prolyl cis-trans isomerase